MSEFEWTGYSLAGDEVKEWHDDEINQHGVIIVREHEGQPNLTFYFATQDAAHTFFQAACEVRELVED